MAETNINGYLIDLDAMSACGCGMIGIATKDGKKYFCKKFHNPVEPVPNGALGPRAIEANQAAFDLFKERKLRVNNLLREISGPGGNIVFPIEDVVYDHHWIEFSEYIEGALPKEEYASVIAGLSEEDKLLVLKIAIGALKTIHSQHLVHADLKLENIMLVKNSSGNYVSKIIDFDGAFFEDDVPLDSIIGTADYYSPELALYSSIEDKEQRKNLSKYMTARSDIFTMGLVLHEYLTGKKPEADILPPSLQRIKSSVKIYPWQVLLAGDRRPEHQLALSGEIKEPVYIALISDMLCMDPEERPSIEEVLMRLNSKKVPIDTEAWPEDGILISEERVREKFVRLRRREEPLPDGGKRRGYEVILNNGKRFFKAAEELVSDGVADMREAWPPPRPEDKIKWNLEQLQKMFISIRPSKAVGSYELIDKRRNRRVLPAATLRQMGLAVSAAAEAEPKPPVAVTTPGALWPADEPLYRVNEAFLREKGVTFLGASTLNGIQGYHFKMPNGTETFHPVERCIMIGFIQRRP